MVTIVAAKTEDHMHDFRMLVREFVSWAISTFRPDQTAPPAVFGKLEQELSVLPGKYSSPDGGLLLAYVDGEVAGCVAGFKSEGGDFEVTRLWVRPDYRGQGVGDKLVDALLMSASRAGYERSVLRSHQGMVSAHKIYRRAGFVDIDGRACFSNFEEMEIAMRRDFF